MKYSINDGSSMVTELVQELKNQGAKYNFFTKKWEIENPTEDQKNLFKHVGLRLGLIKES